MTWWELLVLALVLTIVSFRHINILLSLGATIGWFALMAYNLDHPPTNIIQGSVIHQWLTMGFIAVGLGTMLMFFRNRGRIVNRSESWGEVRSRREGGGEEVPVPERRGLMDMTSGEYRATVRRAVRRRK